MNWGEIVGIVKRDNLIKAVGVFLLKKDGERNHHLVSQKIRELGCLLQHLRIIDNSEAIQLSDFIKPEKFNALIQAVKKTTSFMAPNRGQQDVNIPSLAVKLGCSLSKCAMLLLNSSNSCKKLHSCKGNKIFPVINEVGVGVQDLPSLSHRVKRTQDQRRGGPPSSQGYG